MRDRKPVDSGGRAPFRAQLTAAALPGASVTATAADTGRRLTSVSDGEGRYRFGTGQTPPRGFGQPAAADNPRRVRFGLRLDF